MWYFARVEPIPGMERTLRTELMWGESPLPKSMIGWIAADGESAYVLLECHGDPTHSGELEDLQRYFNVVELTSAQPFFIGEHAPHSFIAQPSPVLTGMLRRPRISA